MIYWTAKSRGLISGTNKIYVGDGALDVPRIYVDICIYKGRRGRRPLHEEIE